MFKIIIVVLIAFWVGGLIFSPQKRIIKDLNQLLQIIAWLALSFLGINMLDQIAPAANILMRLIYILFCFGVAWLICHHLIKFLRRG